MQGSDLMKLKSKQQLRHRGILYMFLSLHISVNKRYRIQKGQSKMDNSEKMASSGTQDEDKKNKNTTQYILDINIRKQTQISLIRHELPNKQLEIKSNRTSFYAEIVTDITIWCKFVILKCMISCCNLK